MIDWISEMIPSEIQSEEERESMFFVTSLYMALTNSFLDPLHI